MKQYSDLIQRILTTGQTRQDRTGTGTIGIFGHQMEFDLSEGFPLLTLKKLHIPSIVHELIWLISGDTNIRYLKANKIRIWDEWADADGELGPVYGAQWRTHCSVTDEPIDQLANLIRDLKQNPFSRRHIITAWNPAEIHLMKLPPCHMMMQFYVDKDYRLSCHLYQRSADVFLGVPFNIASYALLTSMIAQVVGYKVGKFVHSFGDAHIYLNHVDQCRIMLNREALPLPKLTLDPSVKDIDGFEFHHVGISNYNPHEALKGQVAV